MGIDSDYLARIEGLFSQLPVDIRLDENEITLKKPGTAHSDFLIHREQGDWAEDLIFRGINQINEEVVAVRYGRRESISAGEEGFEDFYQQYIQELGDFGKKPDILVFKAPWLPREEPGDEQVKHAIAALEVRSSAYKVEKYREHHLGTEKSLSFTPKVEDILLILKWIRRYGVPHFYVQVFFDSVYCISFEKILQILASGDRTRFRIDKPQRNQFKRTINIALSEGKMLAERIANASP